MTQNIEIVILSILASIGFGIVFQIERKNLIFAGIGGGLTRIFYLIFMAVIPYRLVYSALAAFAAALYAEFMAGNKHTPSTYYLYPSIIPLIPGDLFYYMCVGLITSDSNVFRHYAVQWSLAIIGLGVGFVVCSSFSHYMRIKRLAGGNRNYRSE